MPLDCPLCATASEIFFTERRTDKTYYHCPTCDLRFMDPRFHLSHEDERERYLLHQNTPDHLGLRSFHESFAQWLETLAHKGSYGLDFGSGPHPILTEILQSRGYQMTAFDPFFQPQEAAFKRTYDFIVLAEVIEHLRDPKAEFHRLLRLLNPGGFFFISTWLFEPGISFADWSYRRDSTHLGFYSESTFHWLSSHWKFQIPFIQPPRWIALKS